MRSLRKMGARRAQLYRSFFVRRSVVLSAREKLVRVARGVGCLCASVEDELFSRGSRRSPRIVFSALLDYVSETGLGQRF